MADVSVADVWGGVRLDVALTHQALPVRATRHYLVHAGGSTVEMWTTFEATADETVTLGDLNAVALALPVAEVEWTTGLAVGPDVGGSFTPQRTHVAEGGRFAIGAETISTERALPRVTLGLGDDRFFAALAWSGAWEASLDRSDDVLRLSMGLPRMSAWARPGSPAEGPHVIVGAVPNRPGTVQEAIVNYLWAAREGRPFPALTAYNTWFLRGVDIDEETMLRDIDLVASVGLELFQLDAGWYPDTRQDGMWDFSSGLGSWEVDRRRFPRGLGSIGDYARSKGLKYGVWVEPERIARSTIGRGVGAEERYLATYEGRYDPHRPNDVSEDGQICLGDEAARAWVLARLVAFIDEVRPDYLVWDYNRWMVCTREGHGHPVDGGSHAHIQGLYALLEDLRRRYPHVLIENCSGGGHRIDLGLALRTDNAWMDDRTTPSAHVRHNLRGLSEVFPVTYLFSYVMPHADEPLGRGGDVDLFARSRLPGVFGVTADLGRLDADALGRIRHAAQLARSFRGLQARAVTHQLVLDDVWDVVQQVGSAGALVFAFDRGADRGQRVPLRDLDPLATYEVHSIDSGLLGRALGADLMLGGLAIEPSAATDAQIFVLRPVAASARR
ncbi:MAG: alpha-galactosidase [Acidobacteriota bacterium]